jgi:hypothetical protein
VGCLCLASNLGMLHQDSHRKSYPNVAGHHPARRFPWVGDSPPKACWLTHGKKWNFDWVFSVQHRVPILNCAEWMKKSFMYVSIK